MVAVRAIRRTFVLVLSLLAAVPAAAQQTGEMSGKVTDTSGGVLPGVTVEARSDVLPSARVAVTEAQSTNAEISGLAQAAQKIGDVVKLIRAIA